MTSLPCHEVFALRYAHVARRRQDNFMEIHDAHDLPMPMDYFVWLIRGEGKTILVDTGFNQQAADARGRTLLRCPIKALEALGLRPQDITDTVITHMHYDHAGNTDLLPQSRFHLQEAEMRYATGRYMLYKPLRQPFNVQDVVNIVRGVYQERVVFHDGDSELAPGIELLKVGGHTLGLQAVRVHTARGWVVLASDASHYYDNMEMESPFPVVFNVGDMLDGYRKLLALADSPAHLIPGHDPLVRERYPFHGPADNDVVALHLPPSS
ncbi:N-acyl homoserine lactonase family protein [Pseudomonas citronellolis]|uniref:N-acyl homoserine lactonase family protein n=1 Tax=Pseudomonas citronellolis TaxID=53408 RepID=UPI00077891F2|nr:N-acyl homoserine lactonase family protein [Pseudomonas citronellolis]AMO76097.1 N-acyl homoserine lactonase [Pseudomonas citronellolis]